MKTRNKALLIQGILAVCKGQVGGVIVSVNGIIRGSVHRKVIVRQKKI